jgi:hypothetical protein
MSSRIVSLIAISVIICWSSVSYASQVIKQETKGDQSPNITVLPGGHSELHYESSRKAESMMNQALSEIRQEFSKCLDVAVNFQNKKLDELNRQLSSVRLTIE